MGYKAISVLLCFLFFASLAQAETWKITSLDWQPYSGSQLTNQGNSIQKLRQVLRKEGIELIVEFYPWKRAQMLAGKPDYIGYFPAWPEEVSKGFMASKAVDTSELGVVTSKKIQPVLQFDSIDALFKRFNVGYISTYVYPDKIVRAIKSFPENANSTPHEMSLMKKISIGRIDAGITDPNVTLYLAQREGIDNIVSIQPIIEKKPLVVAFRDGDDNVKRLKLLNDLLE